MNVVADMATPLTAHVRSTDMATPLASNVRRLDAKSAAPAGATRVVRGADAKFAERPDMTHDVRGSDAGSAEPGALVSGDRGPNGPTLFGARNYKVLTPYEHCNYERPKDTEPSSSHVRVPDAMSAEPGAGARDIPSLIGARHDGVITPYEHCNYERPRNTAPPLASHVRASDSATVSAVHVRVPDAMSAEHGAGARDMPSPFGARHDGVMTPYEQRNDDLRRDPSITEADVVARVRRAGPKSVDGRGVDRRVADMVLQLARRGRRFA